MQVYIQLLIVSLLPLLASIGFYFLQKKTAFGEISYMSQQVLMGIVFGVLSILGTELGVTIEGATINVRDAAPLCAGLIFGAPAGIISGLIGGVERYIGVAWGLGAYTQIACSVATIVAGFTGAFLKRYVFKKTYPSWFYGFAIAAVIEVFHMLLVFITHMNDAETALGIVSKCTVPMILANSTCLLLTCLIINLIDNRHKAKKKHRTAGVMIQFQRYLLFTILSTLAVICLLMWNVLNFSAMESANRVITINLEDVTKEIKDAADAHMLAKSAEIGAMVDTRRANSSDNSAYLKQLCETKHITEINIIDENGIITDSSEDENLDFNMASGSQSAEFLCLLDGSTKEYVQDFQSITRDSTVYRKYAGTVLQTGGFIQIGYDAERLQADLKVEVQNLSGNRHILETGYILIADDKNDIIASTLDETGEKDVSTLDSSIFFKRAPGILSSVEVFDEPCYSSYQLAERYKIIGVLPQAEANLTRDISMYLDVYVLILTFAVLFVVICLAVRNHITNNVAKLNSSLVEITDGNLDTEVNVRENAEFQQISDNVNKMVAALKGFITEAETRMDKDLKMAKSIQHSALPSVFPPYPNRLEFDIYATMDTAKQVGGDFYDFYLLGDKLAFLIADVSGKGVPAAMFMMTAKTLIKGYAESGLPVDEVFTYTNEKLCEGNEAGMFVTAWMGILDLENGHVDFVNAGHNPPLIRHKNGTWEYMKSRPGFVLAGIDNFVYKKQELQLEAGDKIYLYTDGVTEAHNINKELYGEDRLLKCLDRSKPILDMSGICAEVKKDLDKFVAEADQFDDITMLALKYKGDKNSMKELTLPATIDNIRKVTAFVDEQLQALDCPRKTQYQIDVAIDELLSNIAKFAYNPDEGPVTVRTEVQNDPLSVTITFIDHGVPYDPLTQKAPDVTLSADERDIGGLGIYLVRNTMDDLTYEYKEGKNILAVKKMITK